ncbi:hypothetical protein J3R82DRAFT_6988, partial [Butyriboletus roseoflavus]
QTTPEIQWTIVWLSRFLNFEHIAMCVDTSTCTVKRVLSHFCRYGTVSNPGE